MSNPNYVDVYEQVIDEDPESGDYFESKLADDQLELFDELEEQAYEDLARQTKKSRVIQSGFDPRSQAKRPLSKKLISAL